MVTFQFSIDGEPRSLPQQLRARRWWEQQESVEAQRRMAAVRRRWEARVGFPVPGTRVRVSTPVVPAAAGGHGPTVRGNPWAFAKSEPSTICDETLGLFKLWAQLSPWWNWWLGFSRTATKPQILTVKRVDRGRVRLILSLKKLSGPASSFLYFFCRL